MASERSKNKGFQDLIRKGGLRSRFSAFNKFRLSGYAGGGRR